jgi:hypothetical protein
VLVMHIGVSPVQGVLVQLVPAQVSCIPLVQR